MRLVLTLVVRDAADVVDAQIAYHLHAGVDHVIATDHASKDGTLDILASYEREGYLTLIREAGAERRSDWQTRMARLAATEHQADWVINSGRDEFWWPRAENLKEVLAPIPSRYTIVQGLRRVFLPDRTGGDLFTERMTRRRSTPGGDGGAPATMLRPLHRADPQAVVHADATVTLSRSVPLRAWYPIEVFDFSGRTADPAHSDSLVEDTRLRDALRVLRQPEAVGARAFALPGDGSRLSFPTPDIVDDAAYAVECAAVGEVDLPRLEQYIAALEQRVGWLEQRLWPRVLRAAGRLVRREPR